MLKDEVEKGAFDKTTVRWERGHPVTLVIFDRDDQEVERHDIETWKVDAVREALQKRGFHHTQAKLPTPRSSGLFGVFGHDSGVAERAEERTQPVNARRKLRSFVNHERAQHHRH